MNTNSNPFVLIPTEDLNQIKINTLRLLDIMENELRSKQAKLPNKYITAQEFMDALSISRSTFDQLRDENKIKVIQKGRKLYLPASEIDSYMNS